MVLAAGCLLLVSGFTLLASAPSLYVTDSQANANPPTACEALPPARSANFEVKPEIFVAAYCYRAQGGCTMRISALRMVCILL